MDFGNTDILKGGKLVCDPLRKNDRQIKNKDFSYRALENQFPYLINVLLFLFRLISDSLRKYLIAIKNE